MKKRILLLTILCFFICAGQGMGAGCPVSVRNYNYYPNDLAIVTGSVVAIGRNTIDVLDEEQKRVERFIYLENNEQFHQGDYIRIYYHPETTIITTIKRMTVLEYKTNGQNLGYISKS